MACNLRIIVKSEGVLKQVTGSLVYSRSGVISKMVLEITTGHLQEVICGLSKAAIAMTLGV